MMFVRSGMLTTVQDLGRPGHRAVGVPLSGAMDPFALRLANLLVGNAENAPALEMTLVGPEIILSEDGLIAVTGAEFPGVPTCQPFEVKAGHCIKFGAATKGCRGYLAIAGSLKATSALGSFATNLRDAFGGHAGRALHDGDVIRVHPAARKVAAHWQMSPSALPHYSTSPIVRVVSGAQGDEFGDDWPDWAFKVTPRSDRMGLRLSGRELKRGCGVELFSSAVAPGTVQVPPDGQPIVLMADAQTIGGYPQLAHVISVDLSLVAQLRTGDTINFRRVSLEEAHKRLIESERALALLQKGLAEKFL